QPFAVPSVGRPHQGADREVLSAGRGKRDLSGARCVPGLNGEEGMLSKQDNEVLCHVGPGTPMGNMMREYWIPAVRSDELPSPDCPPMRLRLLGENLIAFRTTSGAVGLIQNACPHRGASMFFGRNEEEGLRCVYHGWKFDVTGA